MSSDRQVEQQAKRVVEDIAIGQTLQNFFGSKPTDNIQLKLIGLAKFHEETGEIEVYLAPCLKDIFYSSTVGPIACYRIKPPLQSDEYERLAEQNRNPLIELGEERCSEIQIEKDKEQIESHIQKGCFSEIAESTTPGIQGLKPIRMVAHQQLLVEKRPLLKQGEWVPFTLDYPDSKENQFQHLQFISLPGFSSLNQETATPQTNQVKEKLKKLSLLQASQLEEAKRELTNAHAVHTDAELARLNAAEEKKEAETRENLEKQKIEAENTEKEQQELKKTREEKRKIEVQQALMQPSGELLVGLVNPETMEILLAPCLENTVVTHHTYDRNYDKCKISQFSDVLLDNAEPLKDKQNDTNDSIRRMKNEGYVPAVETRRRSGIGNTTSTHGAHHILWEKSMSEEKDAPKDSWVPFILKKTKQQMECDFNINTIYNGLMQYILEDMLPDEFSSCDPTKENNLKQDIRFKLSQIKPQLTTNKSQQPEEQPAKQPDMPKTTNEKKVPSMPGTILPILLKILPPLQQEIERLQGKYGVLPDGTRDQQNENALKLSEESVNIAKTRIDDINLCCQGLKAPSQTPLTNQEIIKKLKDLKAKMNSTGLGWFGSCTRYFGFFRVTGADKIGDIIKTVEGTHGIAEQIRAKLFGWSNRH